MPVIRGAQMEAFGAYMTQQFERRMAAHLRSAFPEQTGKLQEPELRETVHARIGESSSHGLEYQDEIQRYLDYTMIYGPGFQNLPWVSAILTSGESGPTKVRLLAEQHRLRSETKP